MYIVRGLKLKRGQISRCVFFVICHEVLRGTTRYRVVHHVAIIALFIPVPIYSFSIFIVGSAETPQSSAKAPGIPGRVCLSNIFQQANRGDRGRPWGYLSGKNFSRTSLLVFRRVRPSAPLWPVKRLESYFLKDEPERGAQRGPGVTDLVGHGSNLLRRVIPIRSHPFLRFILSISRLESSLPNEFCVRGVSPV